MRAKRTIEKFDQVKVVLTMKFMSLGCIMVTLRSKTLLYMNTSYCLCLHTFEIKGPSGAKAIGDCVAGLCAIHRALTRHNSSCFFFSFVAFIFFLLFFLCFFLFPPLFSRLLSFDSWHQKKSSGWASAFSPLPFLDALTHRYGWSVCPSVCLSFFQMIKNVISDGGKINRMTIWVTVNWSPRVIC